MWIAALILECLAFILIARRVWWGWSVLSISFLLYLLYTFSIDDYEGTYSSGVLLALSAIAMALSVHKRVTKYQNDKEQAIRDTLDSDVYQLKDIYRQAMQFSKNIELHTMSNLMSWIPEDDRIYLGDVLVLRTVKGDKIVYPGDWILKDSYGNFYKKTDEEFQEEFVVN